jgi:hypothetical protein
MTSKLLSGKISIPAMHNFLSYKSPRKRAELYLHLGARPWRLTAIDGSWRICYSSYCRRSRKLQLFSFGVFSSAPMGPRHDLRVHHNPSKWPGTDGTDGTRTFLDFRIQETGRVDPSVPRNGRLFDGRTVRRTGSSPNSDCLIELQLSDDR